VLARTLRLSARHAREFPDSLENSRDALQYTTPVAWFTLCILTTLDDRRSSHVIEWLNQAAAEMRSTQISRVCGDPTHKNRLPVAQNERSVRARLQGSLSHIASVLPGS